MFSLFYLAIVGTVIAFLLYYWLVHNMDVTKTMLIALVTPVTAVILKEAHTELAYVCRWRNDHLGNWFDSFEKEKDWRNVAWLRRGRKPESIFDWLTSDVAYIEPLKLFSLREQVSLNSASYKINFIRRVAVRQFS